MPRRDQFADDFRTPHLDGQTDRAAIWARLLLLVACAFTATSVFLLASTSWR